MRSGYNKCQGHCHSRRLYFCIDKILRPVAPHENLDQEKLNVELKSHKIKIHVNEAMCM